MEYMKRKTNVLCAHKEINFDSEFSALVQNSHKNL